MNFPPTPPDPDDDDETTPLVEAMRALSHVTTAVAMMLISGGVGYLIDRWLDFTFFSVMGFALGVFAAIRYLIRMTTAKK